MRWLSLALIALTGLVWWMVVDIWPTLPERIPLLLWHTNPDDWWVDRTPTVWFVPPALANALALVVGFVLPRRLVRRAAAGEWLPVPGWSEARTLPAATRVRVVQPVQLAMVFSGLCLVILVGHWWSQAEGIALGTARGKQGREVTAPLTMVGAIATAAGAAVTMLKVRVQEERRLLARRSAQAPR